MQSNASQSANPLIELQRNFEGMAACVWSLNHKSTSVFSLFLLLLVVMVVVGSVFITTTTATDFDGVCNYALRAQQQQKRVLTWASR